MKRIIVLFMLLSLSALALACNSTKNGNREEYHYDFLADDAGTYKGDVIPNEECAIAVAEAIFNNMEKSESARNYTQQCVSYDEENEIWIVSFWDPKNTESSNVMTLGNDCSMPSSYRSYPRQQGHTQS